MKTQRVPGNPVRYLVFGSALLILGITGQVWSFPTLMFSLLIALLCIVLGFWSRRRHAVLLLVDVWIFAYLYLYLSEYLLTLDSVLWSFGGEITYLTEGFIVASFGATLVGYGLVLQRHRSNKHAASISTRTRATARFDTSGSNPIARKRISAAQSAHVIDPPIAFRRGSRNATDSDALPQEGIAANSKSQLSSTREGLPTEIGLFAIALMLVVIYYVFEVVSLDQLLYVARVQRVSEIDVGSFGTLMQAAVVTLPAVALFLFNRYKTSPLFALPLLVVSAIAILAVLASGTRFLIGFQLGSVLFLLLCLPNPLSRQRLLFVVLIVGLMLIGPLVQLDTRGAGIGNVSTSETLISVLQPERFLSAEGNLRTNALIHLRHAYSFGDRVPENLFIFYWWIPRTFWPEKPTMAGHWVLRELTYESGFSSAHSISGGFAMPALLDFGPIWGAFFSILYGVLIGWFEVYAWRQHDLQRPSAILAGLFYFAVFFMMRSLHTSLIFLMVSSLVSVVPMSLLLHAISSR